MRSPWTWSLLLLLLPTASRADWFDLRVEPGTVTIVWGFCQGALAAPVAGGWVNNASGNAATSEALSATRLHLPHARRARLLKLLHHAEQHVRPHRRAAAHTCNCIGVPQAAEEGRSFDCSRDAQALRKHNSLNEYLKACLRSLSRRLFFVGSIKFKDGRDFDVKILFRST